MHDIIGIVSYNTREVINQAILRLESVNPRENKFLFDSLQDTITCLGLVASPLFKENMNSFCVGNYHDRYSIVFCGVLYNLNEIISDLRFDRVFGNQTNRDISTIDVIAAAFEKWGKDCIEKFNGKFAIAIYDKKQEKVFIARDKIGKSTIYYFKSTDALYFSTSLQLLKLLIGEPLNINAAIFSSFLYHGYIYGQNSVYEGIAKLPQGHIGEFNIETKHFNTYPYYSLIEQFYLNKRNLIASYEEARSALQELLIDSIGSRWISSADTGCFLSGGIDSSLITALTQSSHGSAIKTFSLGFEDVNHDESRFAKDIASYLGTNHSNIMVADSDVLRVVSNISNCYEEPFADPSQIPTMLVSEFVKSSVPSVLSGDGGDELFCGYNIYRNLKVLGQTERLTKLVRPIFTKSTIAKHLPPRLRAIMLNTDEKTKTQLHYYMGSELTSRLVLVEQSSVLFEMEDQFPLSNWQERRMLLDMMTYLPDDILVKVNMAANRVGLDVRAPLLDFRVFELSFRMKHEYKYRRGSLKYILKDLTYSYIPQHLLDRPKHGFSAPIGTWLTSPPLSEQFNDYCSESFVKRQGYFNPVAVKELQDSVMRNENINIGWAYFVLQQWCIHNGY